MEELERVALAAVGDGEVLQEDALEALRGVALFGRDVGLREVREALELDPEEVGVLQHGLDVGKGEATGLGRGQFFSLAGGGGGSPVRAVFAQRTPR